MNALVFSYVAVLILLGVVGYVITGRQSLTALIPMFFGIVVLIVKLVTQQFVEPSSLTWILIGLGLVGFFATASGIPMTLKLMSGAGIERPAAAISRTIMALASIVYATTAFFMTL